MPFKSTPGDEPPQEEPAELSQSVRQRTVVVETRSKRAGKTGPGAAERPSSVSTIDVVQKIRGRKLPTDTSQKKSPPRVQISTVVLPRDKK
jgi:hypothetical protein